MNKAAGEESSARWCAEGRYFEVREQIGATLFVGKPSSKLLPRCLAAEEVPGSGEPFDRPALSPVHRANVTRTPLPPMEDIFLADAEKPPILYRERPVPSARLDRLRRSSGNNWCLRKPVRRSVRCLWNAEPRGSAAESGGGGA